MFPFCTRIIMLHSLFQRFCRPLLSPTSAVPRTAQHAARRKPLQLEALEDRSLPSVGNFDPTFAQGGQLVVPTTGSAVATVESNGAVIVAQAKVTGALDATLQLSRYTPAGTLDPTFGTAGTVTETPGYLNILLRACAVQSDGKILVATADDAIGQNIFDPILTRFNADGSVDSTFQGRSAEDQAGVALPTLGLSTQMTVQPDNKILILDNSTSAESANPPVLFRLSANGSLDMIFGNGSGHVTVNGPNGASLAIAELALQPDGKILLSTITTGATPVDSLTRLNSDGSVDKSFGSNGNLPLNFLPSPANDTAPHLAVQADGKILLAESFAKSTGTGDAIDLARLTTAGALDPTFGSAGQVVTDLGSAIANTVIVAPSGEIYVGGDLPVTGGSAALVVAYTSNGSLDSNFGIAGAQSFNFANSPSTVTGLTVVGDTLMAVGSANNGADLGVARLALASPPPAAAKSNVPSLPLTAFNNIRSAVALGNGISLSVPQLLTVHAGHTLALRGPHAIQLHAAASGNPNVYIQLKGNHGQLTLGRLHGARVRRLGLARLALTGSVAALNSALAGLQFRAAPSYSGRAPLTVVLSGRLAGSGAETSAHANVLILVQRSAGTPVS
jgi:uncharacterized delta-60 repeat protein